MLLFVVAIFLSAFLLFQVQPIIARYILPWYGGSPAVWTTCMLFFQFGLLAGYSYAHALVTLFRSRPKLQFFIHLAVVAIALIFLPITPADELKPTGGSETSDLWGIVRLLALTVGLPYVAISASGPLLQHWFAGAHRGVSPYRLYAVSNLGSLLGLLSYPFVFERMLGLKHQTWWWSGGFVVYGVLALACAWRFWRGGMVDRAEEDGMADGADTAAEGPPVAPTMGSRLLWVVFAACGSAGMLAITNQMCQDVAVVPFLWVLPLALYLTSFIICFDQPRWYSRMVWIPVVVVGVGLMVWLLNRQHDVNAGEWHIGWQIGIFLLAMFGICMVSHGEMVRRKPHSHYLTGFYLLVSVGGACGGLFVSLVAPKIFDNYWELHFLLIFLTLLVGILIAVEAFKKYRNKIWGGVALIATVQALVVLCLGLKLHYEETKSGVIATQRSFHGVIQVVEGDEGTEDHFRTMFHGRINHGDQYLDPIHKGIPSTYYSEYSGVGALMQSLPQRQEGSRAPVKLGVIGLGSGSLAVHTEPGDEIVFYEINPSVYDLAQNYFTYLSDSEGDTSVVLGDARTMMEVELRDGQPREYDVLFVDAFSGDSIPIHLVTEEAFEIYFQHIKEDGCLVCHITNLHIDLSDPIRQLAEKFGREAMLVTHDPDYDQYMLYFSEWVIVTKNKQIISELHAYDWVNPWLRDEPDPIHWTDDYSNLIDVIMWD